MPVKIVPKEEMVNAVGTKFDPSEWIVVDQDRINTFADCTEDHQFIHVDEEAAKKAAASAAPKSKRKTKVGSKYSRLKQSGAAFQGSANNLK